MTDTDNTDGRDADRGSRRERSGDRGSVAVLGALAMVPLLGLLAVVADLGMVHARRLELQTATEAAALAGARAESEDRDACATATAQPIERGTVSCAQTSTSGTTVITVSASL